VCKSCSQNVGEIDNRKMNWNECYVDGNPVFGEVDAKCVATHLIKLL